VLLDRLFIIPEEKIVDGGNVHNKYRKTKLYSVKKIILSHLLNRKLAGKLSFLKIESESTLRFNFSPKNFIKSSIAKLNVI